MSEPTSKVCTKCKRDLPLEEYHRKKTGKFGREARCKACKAGRMREYRSRPEVRERHAEYREANRERIAKYRREYYEANRECYAERHREYHQANRERELERIAGYREANPHVYWTSTYRFRCKRMGITPTVEDFTKADLIAKWGDSCHYCETGAFEELDHFVPVSKGGHHTLENCVPSCHACNYAKRDANPEEWVAEQERLDAMGDDEMNAAIDDEIARWLDDGDEHDMSVTEMKVNHWRDETERAS